MRRSPVRRMEQPMARGGRGDSVTIRDVAREADVSIATVSRVLRDSDVVAATTRDRVLQVVDRLAFTPSRAARSLAERRHAANGIAFPDLSGPYFAEVVLGYEEVAAGLGRSVLILSTHGRDAAPEMVRSLATRVDGLVVLGRTVTDEVVAEICRRGTPVVLLARPVPHDVSDVPPIDVVASDNRDSARELVTHLVADGHRRIAFAGRPEASPDVTVRWETVRGATVAAGVPAAQLVDAGFGEDDGAALVGGLLARRDGDGLPDVLMCANDELALGALEALRAAGLAVPGDIAVTGWDDVMAARYAGLTTVRQPMRSLGEIAARLLDRRISDPARPAVHTVLPTDLVVRRSCHAPATTRPE